MDAISQATRPSPIILELLPILNKKNKEGPNANSENFLPLNYQLQSNKPGKEKFIAEWKNVYDDLFKLVNSCSKTTESLIQVDQDDVPGDEFVLQASSELSFDNLTLKVLAMNATDDPLLQAHTQTPQYNRKEPIRIAYLPVKTLPIKYQRSLKCREMPFVKESDSKIQLYDEKTIDEESDSKIQLYDDVLLVIDVDSFSMFQV
jgi:hypothetical protein